MVFAVKHEKVADNLNSGEEETGQKIQVRIHAVMKEVSVL